MAAFALEAVLAGGNSVAIRFSNRELAPLWGATLRFALATAVLAFVMVILRIAVPRGRVLLGAVLFGLFQFAGAFGLYYYALVDLQAGLGQTLLALVPLATLGLAVAQGQERLSARAVAGASIGLVGVAVISSASLQPVPVWSLLAVLGSVLCFAQALVVVRRFPSMHPIAANGVGMAVSVPVLLAVSTIARESPALPSRGETVAAVIYVALVGSVVVFLLHVFVVRSWSASRTSYVMVLIPVVTVGLSAWLDGEPLTPGLIIGAALVISGVYVGALRHRPTAVPVEEVVAG